MSDVFRAGVEPGGLTTDYEIKVLVCYLLYNVGRPMPISALIEVFVSEGIGNYFEAANAAASLVKSKHILIESVNDEHCYCITKLGESAALELENTLPPAVREKALGAAKRYFVMKNRRAQNSVDVKRTQDGFLLTLTIHDIGSDLLTMTILLPEREDCDSIVERFIKDPLVTYKGVVSLLTGNYESLGGLIDDE